MEEKRKRLFEFRKPRTGELLSFKSKQYYVSKDGMVWNDGLKRFVAQHEMYNGYMTLNLTDDDGKHHVGIMVHNLVAACYIRLLELGEVVHHIDHDRKNNNLSNLKIIHSSEHQRQHSIENWSSGRMGGIPEKVAAKLRNVGSSRPAKRVVQLSLDGRVVKVWPSVNECGRNYFQKSAVAACCRGCYSRPGNNVYKGFKWQYLEDYQRAQQPTVTSQPVQIELGN